MTGPGGPFEIVVEDVLGVPLQVYRKRLGSMRDLVAHADGRGDVDWVVQGDRRLTYGEHNALVRRAAAALLELGVRARRPGRGALGEQRRVGRDVLGVRGASALRACR